MQVSWSQAISHPDYLGAGLPAADTWGHWIAVGKSIFGEQLTPEEQTNFQEVCGWPTPPDHQVDEAWVVKGRRAGGSQFSASVAAYLATFRAQEFQQHLSPGEKAMVLCLSQDKEQASVLIGYVHGMLAASPKLQGLLPRDQSGEIKEPSDSIQLTNGITIKVRAASYRGVRGFTAVAVLCDELAFWQDHASSKNPADFIVRSVRPTLASMPGSMLLAFSSPWSKRGVLWEHHRDYYHGDQEQSVICFQGASRTFNPTLPQRVVDKAIAKDPDGAKTEYLAQFRTDVQVLFGDDNLTAVIVPGRRRLEYQSRVTYFGAIDASGGRSDSFTMAVAHMEGDKLILDRVAERVPPFSPEAVCKEFAALLKQYNVTGVVADKYAAQWVTEGMGKQGIKVQQEAPAKTILYQELLAKVNSEQVELLDHEKLTNQLRNLERHVRPGGQEKIYEPPNAHDDLANAAALVLWATSEGVKEPELAWTWVDA